MYGCVNTDHGHCGIINTDRYSSLPPGYVLNDPTLDILAQGCSHAEAGADVVPQAA